MAIKKGLMTVQKPLQTVGWLGTSGYQTIISESERAKPVATKTARKFSRATTLKRD